ncbi:uncharacterized protein HaLaN_23202 [Haematococcus lacustris]|uniref:protein-tyrosine sulfotransferase n=1 Tax=Haematococcus lacustris TaxID=44745 RepID=A0A699ZTJ9_HAELA|nr:uncharacterized protein HaLaN_23202 [Haematococcus lacustris]
MAWSWDLGHIAAQINMTWRLAQHWEATLPGRMHTLLYEELVAHPELAARRLLAACGLDWAPQVLRFHTLDRPDTQLSAPLTAEEAAELRAAAAAVTEPAGTEAIVDARWQGSASEQRLLSLLGLTEVAAEAWEVAAQEVEEARRRRAERLGLPALKKTVASEWCSPCNPSLQGIDMWVMRICPDCIAASLPLQQPMVLKRVVATAANVVPPSK